MDLINWFVGLLVCVLEKKKKRKEKQKKNGAVNYNVLIGLEIIIIVGGDRGREPGRIGDEREKGGKREFKDGG